MVKALKPISLRIRARDEIIARVRATVARAEEHDRLDRVARLRTIQALVEVRRALDARATADGFRTPYARRCWEHDCARIQAELKRLLRVE
jgi:hypothetical protein